MTKEKNAVVSKLMHKCKDKKLKEFTQNLYREAPEYELETISLDHLFKAAESTFKIFKSKTGKAPKVNIFISDKDTDIAVIEITSTDIPFLIDSVSNELKSQQCEIHLIVHPILHTKRDNAGHFISFDPAGEKESVMQFHISNLYDEDYYGKLKTKLLNILECIGFAVEDWRKMTAKMLESIDYIKGAQALQSNELKDETIAFLEWLINNHMVFLGTIEYKIDGNKLIPIESTRLGVTRSKLHNINKMQLDEQYTTSDPIFIRKWDERSVVHRISHMDLIVIKKYDNKGKCIGAYMVFGLFTSTVYYQSVRNIPLMRKKIASVIERYGYPQTSHNCKELITAMESFPRGELLKMSQDELYETSTAIVSLSLIPRVKVFIRKDQTGKFISCIIFIPERRFSTEARRVIEEIVCKHLQGTISKRYVQVGESALVRMQLILRTEPETIYKVDIPKLEQEILKAISVWSDDLFAALTAKYPKKEALLKFNKYQNAFDIKYRSIFEGSKSIHDIKLIEEALDGNKVCFDLYMSRSGSGQEGGKDLTQLKIYSPYQELPLSSTLPVIENMGLFAQDVYTYSAQLGNGERKTVFIHHFRLHARIEILEQHDSLRHNLQAAFEKVWNHETDDDRYNSLIIAANISWREVVVLRAIVKYLKLTEYPYSFEYSLEILQQHSPALRMLVDLFNLKFDPKVKRNAKAVDKKIADIKAYVQNVKSVGEDRVLSSYLGIIMAMKRTNYFQFDENGHHKNYLSFKIASSEVLDLPKPRPYAEIYVYSTRVEAVHLRGGKVARGGIRWSDRKEDFRTEVLGLMKAQMTKISVIVPVGSKGGFIVKKVSPADGRDEYLNEGVQCYQTFLSGLLDITDDIINNKVVPPKHVVRYDEDDPYLVVAADKGTATFSDYANQISAKYNFWLDDAFASGGSAGYDHKKMGITAKGGWISVKRHFEEMGIDIDKQTFTCIGIGDMAGDVFGNGMLLSDNMKLIAAFNHAHIFLDPNPDTQASFKERVRLFNKPRSQWTDYDEKLISKGGGIYDRKAKTIQLSQEVKRMLGVDDSSLSPDNLIHALLKAPVDLLWNGGIGTYVKSSTESNDRIGDKSNDALRVNGCELKCKLIGEGGNLGMTQLGRIEYARSGGRLNTDFIDNSAGVDCSDHEVNLKIATSDMIRSGKLKRKDRDKLLTHMTSEVAQLVLMDNYKQTQIITIENQSKYDRTNLHAWFIRYLESKGELERKIEYLPPQDELSRLLAEKSRLSRPEVAVILAYAKNSATNMLTKHDISKEKFMNTYLEKYFPAEFQKKYPKLIEAHKLKNEILATVLVNDFINTMGCTYFHQLHDDLGASAMDIISAYAVVKEVFNIDEHWKKVEKLSSQVPISMKLALFNEIQQLIERNILWLLNQQGQMKNLDVIAHQYVNGIAVLRKKINQIATPVMQEEFKNSMALYAASKEALVCADEILSLKMLTPAFDIISTAKNINKDITSVATVFFQIGERLSLTWLLAQAKSFVARQYFQIVALRSLITEMHEIHTQLTRNQVMAARDRKSVLESCTGTKMDKYVSFIDDLKAGDTTDAFISKLTIAVKKVRVFLSC